jgi:hypothetical protein
MPTTTTPNSLNISNSITPTRYKSPQTSYISKTKKRRKEMIELFKIERGKKKKKKYKILIYKWKKRKSLPREGVR